MDDDQAEKNSFRKVVAVIAIVVLFFAVLGVVIYALVNSGTKQEAVSSTESPAPWPRIATKEQVQKDITDLDKQLKQSAADQAAAAATLKDNEKHKKVGN